ncbi:MAG: pyridoxal phosphate-dependent aminotransferase [Candidatus Sulfopaludibacter sp.]|nr:pyridoxal phosphate-dependent aminotransferase [Candidatus Sulfopaludibacter sp.]
MFSSRFHWDSRPNRLTGLLAQKRSAGAPILDLTESNPTHAGLHYPPGMLAALADPRALQYEPAPAGSTEARGVVSAYYAARGCAVDAARILLTASTSEAYAYLFKLLADPGDEVLAPRPSYPLFEYLATMESVTVRQYPLVYHGGWSMDLDALAAEMSQKTRAVILVNPNNPTGSYVKRRELAELVRLCAGRGVALISDEVFSDYALTSDAERVKTLAGVEECLTFSMSGLSKIAGLPQMKLGWIAASGPEAVRREAMEKLEWIADTYLSVSTPVQCAAAALLEAGEAVQRQIRARSAENLAFAEELLRGSAANVLAVEGGWYITLQVPRVRSEEEWVLLMLERENVLVQPGYFYDFTSEAFLIVSLLTEPAVFREGFARLKRNWE